MNKKNKMLYSIVILAIIGTLIFIISNKMYVTNEVMRIDGKKGEVQFEYVEIDNTVIKFKEELTKDELKIVVEMLNNKKLIYDQPSCGYDENIKLIIDDKEFLFALDNCPNIKFGKTNYILNISGKEREILNQIFFVRGGFFPAI